MEPDLEKFILKIAGPGNGVSLYCINIATAECRFTEGLLSFHESHHPARIQPVPALLAETYDVNRNTASPVAPEEPDLQSGPWRLKANKPPVLRFRS